MTTVAIIVAGGRGVRASSEVPKQYVRVVGKTILQRTVEKFLHNSGIDAVQVVIADGHHELYEDATRSLNGLLPVVVGGKERQDSVFAGLKAIKHLNPSKVLIHDAARPFVSESVISEVISALNAFEAIDLATDIVDTLRHRINISAPVDRAELYGVQTPQGFRFDKIYNLHEDLSGKNMPDDISIAIIGGLSISTVSGNRENFKITTQDDIEMAEKLIASDYEARVGQGFDVHKIELAENASIPIGGVRIPSAYKVIAHSDGDVVLHALMDALLGSLSLGDIGVHFPPTDPKYKGVDSKELLRHVKTLIDTKGAFISNIDITVLCEAPKIMPHKDNIIKCIAEILNLDKDRVSIKATTTEQLGFIGRGEGIAAQAICMMYIKR